MGAMYLMYNRDCEREYPMGYGKNVLHTQSSLLRQVMLEAREIS